ncbi:hypothetical protein DYQ48_08370 [Xanthomonas hortorum]|nr:hypothetical protein BI317_15080 [Xanthomonas hortorum pv. gardneri]QEW15004.1 hypothetical protein DYQ48_08370 [Xanthomonas hortorum]
MQLKKNAGIQPAFFIARGDICNAVFFDGGRKERGSFTVAGRRWLAVRRRCVAAESKRNN